MLAPGSQSHRRGAVNSPYPVAQVTLIAEASCSSDLRHRVLADMQQRSSALKTPANDIAMWTYAHCCSEKASEVEAGAADDSGKAVEIKRLRKIALDKILKTLQRRGVHLPLRRCR